MLVATGSYTGDGVNNRQITGLGFQPVFVIVRATSGFAAPQTSWKQTAMSGAISVSWDQAVGSSFESTNGIKLFIADGFEVGTDSDVNSTGSSYHFFAFGDDSAVIFNGSYVGDGLDNRNITTLPFQPDVLFGGRSKGGALRHHFWVASKGGDNSMSHIGSGPEADFFQTNLTNGFQVGATQNFSGATIYFTAFKATSGNVANGGYTGNAVDNRNIVQANAFLPKVVFIVKASFPGVRNQWRQDTFSGDQTAKVGSTPLVADRIQSFNASGFQIGADADVNASGGDYHFISFASQAPGTQFDRVIPLHYKSGFIVDRVIPALYSGTLNADREIPLLYDIDNLLRAERTIPLQYALELSADRGIPLDYRVQPAIDFDRTIPVQYAATLNVDREIPLEYGAQDDWVPDPDSEPDAFAPEGASEADVWVKDGPSEADAWTPS